MARLGASVRLATMLADDAPGRAQERDLIGSVVDLGLSLRAPGASTPRAVIAVASAARRMNDSLTSDTSPLLVSP